MKSLKEYIINESKYLSKLDLKGIPNSDNPEYEVGHNQEEFIVSKLNEVYPEYKWVTTKKYYGNSYNTNKDLVDGDILGLKDNNIKFYIDVKVASDNVDKKYLGVISLNSVLNFGNKNHYYLCVNNDGSNFIIKKSAEIKELFNNTKKCLKKTKRDNRDKFIKKDLDKYIDKYIDQTEDVSLKDYIPSYLIK